MVLDFFKAIQNIGHLYGQIFLFDLAKNFINAYKRAEYWLSMLSQSRESRLAFIKT